MGSALIVLAFIGINLNLNENSNLELIMQNVTALAEPKGGTALWFRTDEDCLYTYKGTANKSITININGQEISGRFDKTGEFSYRVKDGQTHCTAGGHELCSPRYCPVAIVL